MCDAMVLQLIYAATQLCTGMCASLAAASQKLYRTMTTQLHRAFLHIIRMLLYIPLWRCFHQPPYLMRLTSCVQCRMPISRYAHLPNAVASDIGICGDQYIISNERKQEFHQRG